MSTRPQHRSFRSHVSQKHFRHAAISAYAVLRAHVAAPPEAPSEVIVNVNKDEADHTTVVISWVFDAGSSEIRGDR